MNSHQLISKFIAQICEKQYAFAHNTLSTIIEAKMKEKIKKIAAKSAKKDPKKGAMKDDKKKSSKMAPKKNK
jgi:hypothetical protein